MVRLVLLVIVAASVGGPEGPIVAQSTGAYVVKVVGDRHQLALLSDGAVVGWGGWRNGELGPVSTLGLTTPWTARPVALDLPGKAVDVAASDGTSYAVLTDGTVWAWGDGRQGELGTGPKPSLPLLSHSTRSMEYRGAERPVKVAIDGVAAIAAAGHTALAILRDGTVSQWPRRRSADAEPVLRPVAVPKLAGITQVAVGWSHTLALAADGRVWAWGGNDNGALGVEPKGGVLYEPVQVPGLAGVTAVAAAGDVSFALTRDGTVWVWGSNGHGQFGNGARTSHPSVGTQSVPQRVPGVAHVVAMSAGLTGRHVLVLLEDGTLRGWGNTDFGQLGAGVSGTFQVSPVTPKIANVKAVFAVGNSSFAVKADHSLWAWGNGDRGRWPFQSVTKMPMPIALP